MWPKVPGVPASVALVSRSPAAGMAGTLTLTAVPRPGAGSTSTSPDSRLTRRRIAVSPKPPVSDEVNPTPSSLMSATTTSPDSALNGDPVCDGWW